ncbi:MAG TPA: sigma-54 dependent transcriptional regulator [Spirochaetales bacterium]|nr:sigma-54 dependent transcriptional regulator [Spirochaetales bacterium]
MSGNPDGACLEGNENAFTVFVLAGEQVGERVRKGLEVAGPVSAALPFQRFDDPEAFARAATACDAGLVIVDEDAPDARAGELVARIRAACPNCEAAVIAERAGLAAEVELFRTGAAALLPRNFGARELGALVEELGERYARSKESAALLGSSGERFGAIISHSPEMEKALSLAARAAASDATVLLRGESGTGKELVARAVHAHGRRRSGPFVPVNIAALSENLIESELFGHAKGSFTGAMGDREGRFEQADGGTLFIDEVGDIPSAIQVKLLRVLQFGTFERVGENRTRKVDVRIIAATNRELRAEVREGRFRADLFYRLDVIPLRLPPLREHREDIPWLVDHFVKAFAIKNRKAVKGITGEAMARIMRHSFPGNVRELENFIERGVALSRGEYLTETDVFLLEDEDGGAARSDAGSAGAGGGGSRGGGRFPEGSYDEAMADFERGLVAAALQRSGGSVALAARELGIGERRLRYRIRTLGL